MLPADVGPSKNLFLCSNAITKISISQVLYCMWHSIYTFSYYLYFWVIRGSNIMLQSSYSQRHQPYFRSNCPPRRFTTLLHTTNQQHETNLKCTWALVWINQEISLNAYTQVELWLIYAQAKVHTNTLCMIGILPNRKEKKRKHQLTVFLPYRLSPAHTILRCKLNCTGL